jgi:hypothetical protein
MTNRFAVLDFEASGLGDNSWPIEVGWAIVGGPVRSLLIQPQADWSLEAWDPKAEAIHGIAFERLQIDGCDPRAVCEALDADLAGLPVLTDAPAYDSHWLVCLYRAADSVPPFKMGNFYDYCARLFGSEGLDTAVGEAEQSTPAIHRAAQDVRHLIAVYEHWGRAAGRVQDDRAGPLRAAIEDERFTRGG